MELPKVGLILGYKHFFDDEPPTNRLSLINKISKIDLIVEFAGSNYRIKPPTKIFFENSISQDLAEIRYHLRFHPSLLEYVINKYRLHLRLTSSNSIVFNRPALIFAENEILHATELNDIEKYRFDGHDQEAIFKYLLLVNDEITRFNSELTKADSFSKLEGLNLALLQLNEYLLPVDPLLTFHRGGKFFEYLDGTDYRDRFNAYINENTGLEPQQFIFELSSMYLTKHMLDKSHNFYYKLEDNDKRIKLFDHLSQRNPESKNPLEFLDLKKSPFLKVSTNNYVLLDNMFLLSLCYDFFIWNFLFDCLLHDITDTEAQRNIIKTFKGVLGKFHENHLKQVLKSGLSHNHYVVKITDELTIKEGKKEFEIADVYIRKGNKIIVGEAKSTSLTSKEKYAYDLTEFYNADKNEFFKKHGLKQLSEYVHNILKNGARIDHHFPSKRIKIFPVLFYNEVLLNNALFAQIFGEEFQSLVSDIKVPCVTINPLTMVHIADIETIEQSLNINRIDIFELLRKHNKSHSISMPFYLTAFKQEYRLYPNRIIDYFKNLILKYSSKNQ